MAVALTLAVCRSSMPSCEMMALRFSTSVLSLLSIRRRAVSISLSCSLLSLSPSCTTHPAAEALQSCGFPTSLVKFEQHMFQLC